MKKSTKLISLGLSGLMVIGLLLSTAIGAKAATVTVTGLLAGATPTWTVNGAPVNVVDGSTACNNVASCSDLAAGMLVTVEKDDITNDASTITVLAGAANSTVTGGVVASFTSSLLTLDGGGEYVIGSYTALPDFDVATGDTVNVTYKTSMDSSVNYAIQIEIVESSVPHTFEGVITAITDTTWTIQDDQGVSHTFTVDASLFPLVFGVGDRVSITFTVVNGEFVASAVQVLETEVPVKTESQRCSNDKSNHPALAKLAAQIFATMPADSGYASAEELQAALVSYFCKGFGVGEIKLAFKYAANSEYTAQMLLALRAQGSGWGKLKKLAKATPKIEEGVAVESATSQVTQGNPNKPDKGPKPGKSDNPGKSGDHGKPDKPGKGKNGK